MTTARDDHDFHALLCAWQLGELSAEDASLVEQRLAAEPQFVAELERIRATVAAVQAAFPTGDRLSTERRTLLVAAAERSARRPRFMIGRRVAAAAAVLLLASFTLLRVPRHERPEPVVAFLDDQRRTDEPSSAPADPGATPSSPSAPPGDAAGDAATGTAVRELLAARRAVELAAAWPGLAPSSDVMLHNLVKPDAPNLSLLVGSEQLLSQGGASMHVYRVVDTKPDWLQIAGSQLDQTSVGFSLLPQTNPLAVVNVETRTGITAQTPQPASTPTLREPIQDALTLAPTGRLAGEARYGVLADTATADDDGSATAERILEQCQRLPGEAPPMMFFRLWGDNPFERTAIDPLSTFSIDVDTASYALARRYLDAGRIPDKAAIRTEEFVNYFRADVEAPHVGTFRIVVDAAPSLFGGEDGNRVMLRVVLRGREVPRAERLPQRLTFVVDTSGSMRQENRLELVKNGLRLLLTNLDERDAIALVTFSGEAREVLPMTSLAERSRIENAIASLSPDGSTNAEAGLRLGYDLATRHLDAEATSRVVLLSDGVANVGTVDQDRINADVAAQRARGIYLNTIGVGLGNHNDVFLEQLADHGDGLCNYIDSAAEAKRALVDNFTGAFVPIARDVKIQVEFDPQRVARCRQLGYENRTIADQDFRNNAVDAGEVGSGHQVVALYEIEPTDAASDAADAVWCTVRVRSKPPHGEGDDATENEATLRSSAIADSFAAAAPGHRRAVLVAQFAEFLRRSVHARGDSLDALVQATCELAKELRDPDFTEFEQLVDHSRALIARQLPADDPLTQAIDAVRNNAILKAELEDLATADDDAVLKELEQENRRLEQRIRELLRRRAQK